MYSESPQCFVENHTNIYTGQYIMIITEEGSRRKIASLCGPSSNIISLDGKPTKMAKLRIVLFNS